MRMKIGEKTMIKRKTKKIITAFVLALSLAASCIQAFAFSTEMPQDTNASRFKPAIEMSVMLGIMDISESMEFEGSKSVTRAELADIALGMLNLRGIVNSEGEAEIEAANGQVISSDWMGSSISGAQAAVKVPKFSDVGFDNEDYAAIQFVSDLGIMSGYGDGTFRPEEPVLYKDMLKVIVTVLGYRLYAEKEGGYPAGYIRRAAALEIDEYVSLSENSTVTREEAAVLICNALEADICNEELETLDGVTLLSKYFNVSKTTGLVTALEKTGLYSEESGVDENGVKIGSDSFKAGGRFSDAMLGRRVTCYYEMDTREVIYVIEREGDNTEIAFDYSEFDSLNGRRLTYYTEDTGKTKTVTMAENAPVIVNGVYADIINNVDFEAFGEYSSDMRLLDSNSDGTYDVLFVNSYKTYIIRNVNAAEERIFVSDVTDASGGSAVIANSAGTSYIPIELNDGTVYRYFRDGAQTTIEALRTDTVISVAESQNVRGVKYTDIYISSVKISGTISLVNEEYIEVNGTRYDMVPNANLVDLRSGYTGTLYLDINNKVAAYSADSAAYDYAVLLGADVDADGVTVIFNMFRKNSGKLEWVKAAPKVVYNRKQHRATEVYETLGGAKMPYQFIAYKLNTDGLVSEIVTPTVYTSWNYSESDVPSGGDITIDRMSEGILSTYTNSTGDAGPGVRGTRKCFRTFFGDFIPADDIMIFDLSAADANNWSVKTGSSNLTHNRDYDCAAYNLSYGNLASIMVIFPTTVEYSSKVRDVSYYDKDCVIVSDLATGVDEDGTVVTQITGYSMGAIVNYRIEYEENKEKAEQIDIGDVWQFDVNSSGKVIAASEIFNSDQDLSAVKLVREGLMGTNQTSASFERSIGIVKEINGNALVVGIDENSTNQGTTYTAPGAALNRLWVTKLGVYGTTYVYWYDAEVNAVEMKSAGDLEPNDLVCISSDYGAVKQILVVKNYK